MNRFDIGRWNKMLHSLSSCKPPIAQIFGGGGGGGSLLMTLVDGQHSRHSDSETLEALPTEDAVLRTQRHCFDTDKFRMVSGGWTWLIFYRGLNPC